MSCAEVMYHPYPYLTYHSAMSPRSTSAATVATSSAANSYFNSVIASSSASHIPSIVDHSSSFSSKKYLQESSTNGHSMARPGRPHSMQHNHVMASSTSPPNTSPIPRTSSNTSSHDGPEGGSSSSIHSSHGSPETPLAANTPNTKAESTSTIHKTGSGHSRAGSADGGDDGSSGTEGLTATDALYVSANCVLFTYYNGDVSSAVDEHISKALSLATGYRNSSDLKSSNSKEISPMSQRNFPASFWNSNYHMALAAGSAADLSAFPSDPYHHHHHHHPGTPSGLHSLHHQTDPWTHYQASLSSQAYSHRAAAAAAASIHHHHDLAAAASYSATTGISSVAAPPPPPGPPSGPNSRYGSLLIQPSMRSGRLGAVHGQCGAAGLGKPEATAWGTHRYHHDTLSNELPPHLEGNYNATYSSMTGIEGPGQESAKDLYWF